MSTFECIFHFILDLKHFLNVLEYIIHCIKMTFSIKDFCSKCDQIHRKLQIWPHLLKKSLIENLIFLCSVINWQRVIEILKELKGWESLVERNRRLVDQRSIYISNLQNNLNIGFCEFQTRNIGFHEIRI